MKPKKTEIPLDITWARSFRRSHR